MTKTFVNSLANPEVKNVLEALYADSRDNDPVRREQMPKSEAAPKTALERFTALKDIYMPIDIEFGNLIYGILRTSKAKIAVEFGTSFGISTLFLAAGIKDNGAGQVITTEFIAEKAAKAKSNLAQAKLDHLVDIRVGDALVTLRESLPKDIDFVLLDGEKSMYLDILKLLEPNLRSGAIIASDNTDHDGAQSLLAHLRNPENGYVSSAVLTPTRGRTSGHEISVRL